MDTHENHSVDAPNVRCAKCWDWMNQLADAEADARERWLELGESDAEDKAYRDAMDDAAELRWAAARGELEP